MSKTPTLCLSVLVLMSVMLGGIEVLFNLQGQEISDSTADTWTFVFLVGTIFWAYYDAQNVKYHRPFDFGFLVYVFWPVAFPWYLIKTRGIEGMMIYLGFLFLWMAPWVAGLIAYVYYS